MSYCYICGLVESSSSLETTTKDIGEELGFPEGFITAKITYCKKCKTKVNKVKYFDLPDPPVIPKSVLKRRILNA